MKPFFLLIALCLPYSMVQADIYKYTDANGVTTYSNIKPGTKQKYELVVSAPKTSHETASTAPSKSAPTINPPEHFPKVDSHTQSLRDSKRTAILRSELEQEKQALENAKQLYQEAQETPEVYRNAQGKTFRNVAKYEEKLRIIEAEIQAHTRNIELLHKELNP
jgi:Domain of unknown function (DUF4124)